MNKRASRRSDYQMQWVLVVLLALHVCRAADIALEKEYTLSPPGFFQVVFTNRGASGYYHDHVYYDGFQGLLTRPGQGSSLYRGLMWFNATDNITLTLDAGSAYVVSLLEVTGLCCNKGLSAPRDIRLEGSLSPDGPWMELATLTGLQPGEDPVDTPAEEYSLHTQVSSLQSFRYYRVEITGPAGKYISIRSVHLRE